jgi:hypothetical protein
MRKASLFFVIAIIIAVGMAGCGAADKAEYPEYAVLDNSELGCVELSYGGITYRPFGGIGNDDMRGEQIGIREGDPESRICEVEGYDPDEWIIEYLDVFMEGGDMLMKATSVTEIPAELEQYRMYDY